MTCNCRVRASCPLNGKCLISNIIFKATIKEKDYNEKIYVTTSELNWYNHNLGLCDGSITTVLLFKNV